MLNELRYLTLYSLLLLYGFIAFVQVYGFRKPTKSKIVSEFIYFLFINFCQINQKCIIAALPLLHSLICPIPFCIRFFLCAYVHKLYQRQSLGLSLSAILKDCGKMTNTQLITCKLKTKIHQ